MDWKEEIIRTLYSVLWIVLFDRQNPPCAMCLKINMSLFAEKIRHCTFRLKGYEDYQPPIFNFLEKINFVKKI